MKKLIRLSFQLILGIFLTFSIQSCTEPSSANATPTEPELVTGVPQNPIEGAWLLVWGEYGGEERVDTEPFQIKLFADTHFSYLMKSPDGEWNSGAVGTYEIEGDIYRETHLYSSTAENIGVTADWDFEVRKDSLFMNGPTRIVNEAGEEIEAFKEILNSMKEVRVRAD